MPPYRFPKSIFSELDGKLLVLLRQARAEAGLTQVQAAEKLGCRQTFLSKIECGERRLDVIEFVIICDAYGIAPSRLLESLLAEENPRSESSARKSAKRKRKK